jgi:hypothetical protein
MVATADIPACKAGDSWSYRGRSFDRGRDGPHLSTWAAPRTDPSERHYRTRLLPRVRSSKRSHG